MEVSRLRDAYRATSWRDVYRVKKWRGAGRPRTSGVTGCARLGNLGRVAVVIAGLATGVAAVLASSTDVASASSERRWGFSVGYGGEGVTANVNNNTVTQSASRSEGPLVLGVFVEQLLSDSFLLGVEHVRGVSLLPATSEAWFMGISGRWYFFGQAPSTAKAPDNSSTLLIKRFVPFAGFSAGFASADIERQGEPVANVAGSGLYLGIRLGADYMMGPGRGIRPELITSSTDFSSSFANPSASTPPSLVMFALQCSWFFDF